MKTYRVVHFTPQLAAGVFSTKGVPIDLQVTNAIKKEAADGWEFVSCPTLRTSLLQGLNPGILRARTPELMQFGASRISLCLHSRKQEIE